MTAQQRHEHAQELLRRTAWQWRCARLRWERESGDAASYDRLVRPWAEAYERRSREAVAAWRGLVVRAVAA